MPQAYLSEAFIEKFSSIELYLKWLKNCRMIP
jgi:hypothetical protein